MRKGFPWIKYLFILMISPLMATGYGSMGFTQGLPADKGTGIDEINPGFNSELPRSDGNKELKKDYKNTLNEYDPIVPEIKQGINIYEALAVDFLVPGGGSLYYKNYYLGATFAFLKVAGAVSIYYFYRNWEYRRSLYRSARKANEGMDPDHELQFKVSGEGYKSLDELKRDYDRAAQNITFTVFGTVVVYLVSLLVTYKQVEKINEASMPTFHMSFYKTTLGNKDDVNLQMGLTREI